MIDALIQGRIHGKPEQRTGQSGKPYTVAKVRTSARDGEAVFMGCIAFAPAAQSALLALTEGDAVALAGELTLKIWTGKDGTARPAADLLVHQALSAYAVSRKREASDAKPVFQHIQST
ncbi:MAG: single-stranded DNA-binding protein [Comamonadaceae bacterium]|nr:single-stranded DNA-binding protein [Burkholderiales bacterium]MEB2347592.1 single-stranded DNA-binding protein [Comamonadaceae bacterium]